MLNDQKVASLTEIGNNTPTKQPVYKRQRYNFIPYKYGAYSFQLAQDVETLRKCGYLNIAEQRIRVNGLLDHSLSSTIDTQAVYSLRGTSLIRKTYDEYPYYAINSEISGRIMDSLALQKILKVRSELVRAEQVLFTIGYEGKTIEEFVNCLISNNVAAVCDVRKNPISRKFSFSRSKLSHVIETVGIKYIHTPELGIESDKRNKLQTQSDYDKLLSEYRKTLSTREKELRDVYNFLVTHKRIALMCYEQDPKICHRTQIKDCIVSQYRVDSSTL